MKKILFLNLIFLGVCFNNCTAFRVPKDSVSNSSLSADVGLNAFKSAPYTYLTKNCSSCHASIQTPFIASSDVSIAYASARTKMNFINIDSSVLLLQSANKHCKVDFCAKAPAEFKALLEIWKSAEFPPINTGSGSGVLETSGTKLRLAGRQFVAGKLKSLFGTNVSTITDKYIEKEIGNFGGPCDRNQTEITFSVATNGQHGIRIYPDCSSDSDSQGSLIGPTTPARFAFVERACKKILQTDSYLNAGAMTALGVTTTPTARLITDADIQSLYSAFNIGKSPSLEILASLRKVAEAATDKGLGNMEGWRFVFLTLCLSPDWQIP
ncbi:MAG: hypothetical protein A4S09_12335 [Proteobacteria bacterium SG_bin7]|nr:MAG: hypothetical protein A4S09_12335 [Proteobacteria bacterium SG_bin7]